MNGFGISCVLAILLVGLLSVITIANGRIERREQAQADGITRIGILNSSDISDLTYISESIYKAKPSYIFNAGIKNLLKLNCVEKGLPSISS